MPDPVTSLGIAGNAIQFVEFSAKLLLSIYELCDSETGDTDAYRRLRLSTSQLRSVNNRLHGAIAEEEKSRGLTPLEKDIYNISIDCDSAAEELLKTLDSVSTQGKDGRWNAVRQAVKGVWRQRRIERLQQRLDKSRQLLSTSILVQLQQELNTSNQKEPRWPLSDDVGWDGAHTIKKWLEIQSSEMNQWRTRFLDAVSTSNKHLMRENANFVVGTTRALLPWSRSPVATTLIERLLVSLQYQEMPDRQERIAKAFERTFEWIFSDPDPHAAASWNSFCGWLSGNENLYWITGKAGSGKSTLMKLIYNDIRVSNSLVGWAQNSPVVKASFYFWNSGTDLQMSQEGLLRSILYQVIVEKQRWCTTLGLLSPWEAFSLAKDLSKPWTWAELIQAFRILVEETGIDFKYVFFLDGLDEFSGNKSDLISLVKRLASYPNVKICVSSRPWAIFEDAFSQKPNLMLQYRTYDDIRLYVEKSLSSHQGFKELSRGDPAYAAQLVNNTTSKASGVFLWVVLVVRSLLEGLTDGDRISDLQRRLDSLPEELEQLFKKMLGGLKPGYFQHASQLFQTFKAAKTPPTIYTLSFADEEDDEYAFRREISPMLYDEIFYRAVSMKRRLDSRCKGLLEIAPLRSLAHENEPDSSLPVPNVSVPNTQDPFNLEDGYVLAHSEIQYLHRTVKDFMERDEIWHLIKSGCDTNFDPNAALCRSYLLQLKTLPVVSVTSDQNIIWEKINWCLEYCAMVGRADVDLYVRLLDEVDRVACSLTSTKDENNRTFLDLYGNSANCLWAINGNPSDKFLTFALRCHLGCYVEAKLKQASYTIIELTEFLLTAVTRYEIGISLRKGTLCNQDGPDEELIELLLTLGADPNLPVDGISSWRCVFMHTLQSNDKNILLWNSIAALFQKYGYGETSKSRKKKLVDTSPTTSNPQNGFAVVQQGEVTQKLPFLTKAKLIIRKVF